MADQVRYPGRLIAVDGSRGKDVTGIEDPLASYGRFIDRVVTEYENLSSTTWITH